ncbi:MAG: HEAT repeat domain-containing protein [Elusimicrobiota bacterium]
MKKLLILFLSVGFAGSFYNISSGTSTVPVVSAGYDVEADTRTNVDKLSDQDPGVRKRAIYSLSAEKKQGSIKYVMGMLNDPDAGVREAAIRVLGDTGKKEVVGPAVLATLRKERETAPVITGMSVLSKMRYTPAIPVIKSKMEHPFPLIRTYAIVSLAEFNDPSSYQAIKEKINDPAEGVRIEVMRVCAKKKITSAIPDIVKNMKHPISVVRREAAAALGEIGGRVEIQELEKLLDDTDMFVVKVTKEAIEKISARTEKGGIKR